MDERVFKWAGHMDGMDDHREARRIIVTEASLSRLQGLGVHLDLVGYMV